MSKRLFDILFSALGLIAFSVPIVVLSILVRLKIGSPVIFRQERPGLRGETYANLKYRSMSEERDSVGNLLPDCVRLTKFGRFLRSTSLDEIPALWSVLVGDMSLVGPRPLLKEYLPLYSTEQARRHDVRPGITGWAQVNGRNALSWEEKFRLDIWYVDNRTMWLDLKILFLTVRKVLVRDGISAAGEATMPRFTGQPSRDSRP